MKNFAGWGWVSRGESVWEWVIRKPVKKHLTASSSILIYGSIIYLVIIYCLSFWGFTSEIQLVHLVLRKLYPYLRKLIYWIFKLVPVIYVFILVFKYLGYYNTIKNGCFNMYGNVGYYNRSSSLGNLKLPFIATLNSRQPVNYNGPKYWKSIIYYLKLVKTYLTFKRGLKKFVSENQIRFWL